MAKISPKEEKQIAFSVAIIAVLIFAGLVYFIYSSITPEINPNKEAVPLATEQTVLAILLLFLSLIHFGKKWRI